MSQPASPPHIPDRFTLPGDIPDAGYWDGATRTVAAARRRKAAARGEKAPLPLAGGAGGGPEHRAGHAHPLPPSGDLEGERRAHVPSNPAPDGIRMLSHPAGRGWVPLSRDLGIPSEHASTASPELAAGCTVTVEHSFPHGAPDDPVAAVGCSQVFTRERRVRFLDHLAFKGNVRAAAALVGVSHETAYRKRRQDAAFAALWDAALVHARKYNESVLASRALDGVEVPVYYHGEIVGYRIVHDPRLLLAQLARLDRRVEGDGEEARTARAHAGRFDALLAAYAGHAAPADFAAAVDEVRGSPGCGGEREQDPSLPPTREEYVTWHRGQAAGGKDARKEAAAMAAAADAAGAAWDAWHEAALARIGAIVSGEAEAASPRFPAAAAEGPARTNAPSHKQGGQDTASAGHGEAPAPAGPGRDTGASRDTVPADLPYEIKSHPSRPSTLPQNRVTCVNTGPQRPETRTVPARCAGEGTPGVPALSPPAPSIEGGMKTMTMMLKGAAFALAALALTGPAAAQFGPPPAPWKNDRAILVADLGLGNSGRFTGLFNPEMTRLCYILNAGAVSQPTAARIVSGAAEGSGTVVLELENPANGASAGCVDLQPQVARALVDNAGEHRLAVVTAAYPEGYVRAPLRAQLPSAAPAAG